MIDLGEPSISAHQAGRCCRSHSDGYIEVKRRHLSQAQGITTMMKMKRVLVAALVLGLAVAGSAGARSWFKGVSEAPDEETKRTVRGRVVTPDGKPASGAKLYLGNYSDLISEVGATDSDGRFAVDVPQPAKRSEKVTWLLARVPGFGVDFIALNDRTPNSEVELQLPVDRPIRGRVIDLQGKPVAGATIRLNTLRVYGADTVEPFLAGLLKRPNFRSPGAKLMKGISGGTRKLLTATTDKDGRFELAGAGAERLVTLEIAGPGIARAEAYVITRNGFDPNPYNAATLALRPKDAPEQLSWDFNPLLLGPDPTVIAQTEKPIRGVVTVVDSEKPRAAVRVRIDQDDGTQLNFAEATTDRDGRYEIHGAFKAPSYTLTVESDPATGMVRRSVTVPDSPGYETVVVDIKTARGVIITGLVTDQATGKPMPGRVEVGLLFDNPHARKPEYASLGGNRIEYTGLDGMFRIVAIPGRVLLMAQPNSSLLPGGFLKSLGYRRPIADPRYPDYFLSNESISLGYHTSENGYALVQGNWCKVLDIEPGVAEVRQDVALERASTILLEIQDGAGRPVAGTRVAGLTAGRFISALRCESAEVEVYGVKEEGKPRLVTFFDPRSKLTATVTLKGDEKQPVVVTLGPPGILKGRLLNQDGTPAPGVTLTANYKHNQEVFKAAQEPDGCTITDKDGRFQFDRMILGQKYTLWYSEQSKQGMFRMPSRSLANRREFGPAKAGETTDLGDLTLKPGDKEEDD